MPAPDSNHPDLAALRVIRLFDTQLLSALRQGNSSIRKTLDHAGHTLSALCRAGNACILRTTGDRVAGLIPIKDRIVAECIFSPNSGGTGPIKLGMRFGDLADDCAWLHRRIPMYLPGGRNLAMSEWIILIEPKADSLDRAASSLLLEHAAETLGNLLLPTIEYEAHRVAQSLLSVPSFQRRAADNYLAYALIGHAFVLFDNSIQSLSFWRLSRTSARLELVARRPKGVPANADYYSSSAEAFLSALWPVGSSPIRLAAIHFAAEAQEGIRQQVELLENLLCPRGEGRFQKVAQHELVTSAHPEAAPAASMLYCNQGIRGAQLQRLKQAIVELTSQSEIPDGMVAFVLPFGANISHSAAQEPLIAALSDLLEEEPAKLHQLRFSGVLVVALPLHAICCLRLLQLARCAQLACQTLDTFSRQRLQFWIFTKAVERIGRANSREALYDACEFAARQVLDCDAVVEWSTEPSVLEPTYQSALFGNSRLQRRGNEVDDPALAWEFLNSPAPLPSNSWWENVSSLLESRRKELKCAGDGSTASGLSSFAFPIRTTSRSTVMYFVRDAPSRCSALERTFGRALADVVGRAFRGLENIGRELGGHPADDLIEAQKRWLPSADEILRGPVERIAEMSGVKGLLLFHFDADANVLTLEHGIRHSRVASRHGMMLASDATSFAGLCSMRGRQLRGVVLGQTIRIVDADRRDSLPLRVNHLGWLPNSRVVIGIPIFANKLLQFVLVLSTDTGMTSAQGNVLRRAILNECQKIRALLEIHRARQRVQLRELTEIEHRELLFSEPAQPLQSKSTAGKLPPEIDVLYPEPVRSALRGLLHKYCSLFKWHSIGVRVCDWFRTELHRLASAGVLGDKDSYPIDGARGAVAYCFRRYEEFSLVSLPRVSSRSLRILGSHYRDLHYHCARSGTRAEVCIPLVRPDGLPFGTLNIESRVPNAFAFTKWACLRLAQIVQDALSMRAAVYTSALSAAQSSSATFLGHAFHELKNEMEPIRCRLRDETSGLLSENARSQIDRFIREETARLVVRLRNLTDRKELPIALTSEVMALACEQERLRARQLASAGIGFNASAFGADFTMELNEPLFRHTLQAMLSDIIGHCATRRDVRRIRLFVGRIRNGCWSFHLAHDGRAIDPHLARELFWFKVKSGRGSTGVGLAFLGLYFQMLGFYPRATNRAPMEIRACIPRETQGFRTWFNVYARLQNVEGKTTPKHS